MENKMLGNIFFIFVYIAMIMCLIPKDTFLSLINIKNVLIFGAGIRITFILNEIFENFLRKVMTKIR